MGFLQIPPHDGHPCLWLTVPTAKSVADFHRQVIAHAERTNSKLPPAEAGGSFFLWGEFKYLFDKPKFEALGKRYSRFEGDHLL